MATLVEVECLNCGRKKLIPLKHYNKNIARNSKGFFCDLSCSASYHNRHTKLKNGKYIRYRKLAFEHLPPKCAVCGYDVKDVLQVHHIDGNKYNNNINNLCILCPTHHVEVELKLRTICGYNK